MQAVNLIFTSWFMDGVSLRYDCRGYRSVAYQESINPRRRRNKPDLSHIHDSPSLSSRAKAPDPLSDSIFIGPLHWFPLATDPIHTTESDSASGLLTGRMYCGRAVKVGALGDRESCGFESALRAVSFFSGTF